MKVKENDKTTTKIFPPHQTKQKNQREVVTAY